MLRSYIYSILFAICLIATAPTSAHAIRMIDDFNDRPIDGGGDGGFTGGGGGGAGGGGQTTPDPEPQPQPQPDPEPEQPADQGNSGGNGGGPLVGPAVEGFVRNVVKVATKVIEQAATQLADFIPATGGRLNVDTSDVLINMYNQCRWLDNTTDNDVFVPLATDTEWYAFVDHAPAGITRANCCPAATLNLEASDGQFLEVSLPIGREGSTTLSGQRSVSQAFTLTRLDGAILTETLNATYSCQSGAWAMTNSSTDTEVVSDPEDPVVPEVEDPEVPTCVDPTVPTTKTVTATWTGRWRRGGGASDTYTNNGFRNIRGMYMENGVQTSNGSGNRSTVVFTLKRPARDTHVKVTALYGPYSGGNADGTPGNFSNGVTPKVAEFDIADGVPITQVNAPQTLTFHSPHRMGHPFRMENDKVYMPSYDSTPNLYSLTVEYTYQEYCKPPSDAIVFGSNCANTSGATTCISNGTSCVAPAGMLNATLHTGTFCSSVSSSDSGGDGATVTFDLRDQLDGRTGSAMVVIPYDPWYGVRDLATARAVMADPDAYSSIPSVPAGIGATLPTALKFFIPDVDESTTQNVPLGLNAGCGKDCSNNHTTVVQYSASTKQLTVYMYKSGRWKKEYSKGHIVGGECITGGAWHQQYRAGTCNGKVWSEVRVVTPAPSTCGSAVSDTHMSGGMFGGPRSLCTAGTPSEVTQTHDTIGNAPSGFYNWTCSDAHSSVSCQASYSDYDPSDNGGYIP